MLYVTAVEGRRVAVHCHAGLGRTGLAIACFLLACGEARDAVDAVERVRRTRVGALQTAAQVAFVSAFEQCLMHLRCVFCLLRPVCTALRATAEPLQPVHTLGHGHRASLHPHQHSSADKVLLFCYSSSSSSSAAAAAAAAAVGTCLGLCPQVRVQRGRSPHPQARQ